MNQEFVRSDLEVRKFFFLDDLKVLVQCIENFLNAN